VCASFSFSYAFSIPWSSFSKTSARVTTMRL
jgi:hypothetical protein